MSFPHLLNRIGCRIERYTPGLAVRLRSFAANSIGERELDLLPMLVDRAKLALDIGANWGLYSSRLHRMGVSVVAFEANPDLATILKRALPGIQVEACALGSHSGTAMLRIPRMGNGALATGLASIYPFPHREIAQMKVPIRRLDDFELTNVGFIKIDVEGAETEVVSGALETIRRDKPNLLIEATHGRETLEQIVAILAPLGYSTSFYRRGRLEPVSRWSDDLLKDPKPYTNFVFIAGPRGLQVRGDQSG